MSTLVIVESPGKVKTIQRYLGPDYNVIATRGHIMGLPTKGYGFDSASLDTDFDVKYRELPQKQQDIQRLRAAARRANTVLVATDGDREGAAIGFHALRVLGLDWRTARRAVFFEITREALTRAVARPQPLDRRLYCAQQARRLVDRAVGYLVSPPVRRHVPGGQSAGRCQSVALALVVDRATAVDAFHAASPYRLRLQLGGVFKGATMTSAASLPRDETRVSSCVTTWARATYAVLNTPQRRETRQHPSPAHTTSTLQQVAGQRLGLSPKRTMALLQRLYTAGHITYHRTDSVALAPSFVRAAGAEIATLHGQDMVRTRVYSRNKKTTQEAHEAIRPTKPGVRNISGAGAALYGMILRRALATQCRPARVVTATLRVAATDPDTGSRLGEATLVLRRTVDSGFKRVIRADPDLGASASVLTVVESFRVGDSFPHVMRVVASQVVTTPSKPLFSEASLVAGLERVGVGRPSTYSTIVRTIRDRGCVRLASRAGIPTDLVSIALDTKTPVATRTTRTTRRAIVGAYRNKLVPTTVGRAVVTYLRTHFKELVDPTFTATIETNLDAIAKGTLANWRDEVRRVWRTVKPKATAENRRSRATHDSSRDAPLGHDPETRLPIYCYEGRFGPVIRRGTRQHKKYVSVPKGTAIRDVTLDDALFLLSLPVPLRQTTPTVHLKLGRYGFYVERVSRLGKVTTRSIPKCNLTTAKRVTLKRAERLLNASFTKKKHYPAYVKKSRDG